MFYNFYKRACSSNVSTLKERCVPDVSHSLRAIEFRPNVSISRKELHHYDDYVMRTPPDLSDYNLTMAKLNLKNYREKIAKLVME
jgi:hypothetical protein